MTVDDLDCLVSAWLSPGGGGLWVRGSEGPSRQAVMQVIKRHCAGLGLTMRRLPARLSADALDPQMDLAQTLALGRLITMPGLLGQSTNQVLVLPMAERQPLETLQRLGQAADAQSLKLLVFDESLDDEPALAPVLADRMGLGLDLRAEPRLVEADADVDVGADAEPKTQSLAVELPAALAEQAAGLLMSMAILSVRPLQACLRLMRQRAQWCGRCVCTAEDLAWALAFTGAPHARVMPGSVPSEGSSPDEPTEPPPDASDPGDSEAQPQEDFSEQVLEVLATQTLLPEALLKVLVQARRDRRPPARREGGRQGQRVMTRSGRGVRMGLLRQAPRDGRERIAWLPTLRAALPLQRLREAHGRLSVRLDDLHIYRVAHRRPVTTVFLVDASGSMAMNRLNEAKGAVELLLADCYVRRDRVALISVGGKGAQLLLPPTRSLTAAKRALLAMPGGGGSPLGAGLVLAHRLLLNIARAGEDAVLVLLTDGRANLSRDGQPGREQAQAECLALAKPLVLLAQRRLVIDGSVRPEPAAQRLAEGLNGAYLALPHARAQGIHAAIQSATQ